MLTSIVTLATIPSGNMYNRLLQKFKEYCWLLFLINYKKWIVAKIELSFGKLFAGRLEKGAKLDVQMGFNL